MSAKNTSKVVFATTSYGNSDTLGRVGQSIHSSVGAAIQRLPQRCQRDSDLARLLARTENGSKNAEMRPLSSTLAP